MSVVKMMDIVMVDSVTKAKDGTQIAITTSIGDNAKRIIKGIPEDTELNNKTRIKMYSSTNDFDNIDCITVSQLDEKGRFYSNQQDYYKENDGQYRKYEENQLNKPKEQTNGVDVIDRNKDVYNH